MRDAPGDAGPGSLVPWMPTKPPAGPVGQRGRLRARAEGDRAVERAGVAGEAVADVEGARRSGACRPRPIPTGARKHGAPVAQQRQASAAPDRRPGACGRSRSRRDAARGSQPGLAAPGRRARIHDRAARVARAPEDEHEVRRVLGRARAAAAATGARPRRGRRTGDRRAPQRRPLRSVRVGAAADRGARSPGRRARARGCRGPARGDAGCSSRPTPQPATARQGGCGAERCGQPVNRGPLRLVSPSRSACARRSAPRAARVAARRRGRDRRLAGQVADPRRMAGLHGMDRQRRARYARERDVRRLALVGGHGEVLEGDRRASERVGALGRPAEVEVRLLDRRLGAERAPGAP